MWLINATTFELEEFTGDKIPAYTILSHTWEDEEVTFKDMQGKSAKRKAGYHKIINCCRLTVEVARRLRDQVRLNHVWIDSCCIDKSSSAELSEAINSEPMWSRNLAPALTSLAGIYNYYQDAELCFAYLSDLKTHQAAWNPTSRSFERCRWFYRSWTLQELLAPGVIWFYATAWEFAGSKHWQYLGTKHDYIEQISSVTGIDQAALRTPSDVFQYSVAQRMSWAADRKATRIEDVAYSLLGIFDVHMPLLYGEGNKAFIRLQEEIAKQYDDHSLFAWGMSARLNNIDEGPESVSPAPHYMGFLAPEPEMFRPFRDVVSFQTGEGHAWSMTNKGIEISLPSLQAPQGLLLLLNCRHLDDHSGRLAIFTHHIASTGQRVRIDFNVFSIDLVQYMYLGFDLKAFYLLKHGKQLWSKAAPLHEHRMCCRFEPWRHFRIISAEPSECWAPAKLSMRFPELNKVGTIKIAYHDATGSVMPPHLTLRLRADANSFNAHLEVLIADEEVPMHLPKPNASGAVQAWVWINPWTVGIEIRRREVAGQLIISIDVKEPRKMTREEVKRHAIPEMYIRQHPMSSRRSARLQSPMDTTG
jgi:hypothetical protein